jgi:hypothetical protein
MTRVNVLHLDGRNPGQHRLVLRQLGLSRYHPVRLIRFTVRHRVTVENDGEICVVRVQHLIVGGVLRSKVGHLQLGRFRRLAGMRKHGRSHRVSDNVTSLKAGVEGEGAVGVANVVRRAAFRG